jgi:branched-chain amino acid transport system substrate-binding protein
MSRRTSPCVGVLAGALMLIAAACSSGSDASSTAVTDAATPTEVDGPSTTAAPVAESTAAPTVDPTSPPASTPSVTQAPQPATGEPIKVGTIYVDSNGIRLVDNRDGLEALFAAWNEVGGVDGRPIELVAEQGGLDPAATSTAARKLVEEDGVVAMVLPMAPVDCQANGAYYEAQAIAVLFQISDECAPLEVTFPNGGSQASALKIPTSYLATARQSKRIAYIGIDIPSSRNEAENARAQAAAEGAELVIEEYVPFFGADVNSVVVRLKQADVDGVLMSINPMDVPTFLNVAAAQGIGLESEVSWVASPVAYDENLLAPLSAGGDGLLTYTPSVPFTDPALADYLGAWRADDQARPMTGMVVNAWMAADVLRALLASIDGDITRESVLAAAQASGDIDTIASPLPIPMNPTSASKVSGTVIELRDGKLSPVSDLITVS